MSLLLALAAAAQAAEPAAEPAPAAPAAVMPAGFFGEWAPSADACGDKYARRIVTASMNTEGDYWGVVKAVDAATGAKMVLDDVCVGCKVCTIACPFGTVNYVAELGKVQYVFHIGDQSQAPGSYCDARSQVTNDGAQPEGFAQGNDDDSGAQINKAVDQPGGGVFHAANIAQVCNANGVVCGVLRSRSCQLSL